MIIEREPCKPERKADGSYNICVVGKVGKFSTAQTVNYKNDGPEGPLGGDPHGDPGDLAERFCR